MEPAVFLSGIIGLRSQSEDDRNHWEMYLSHDTAGIWDFKVLLHALYEAQNEDIIPYYFTAETSRRQVSTDSINSNSLSTPYDCYALSYCLAHSSDKFTLSIGIRRDDDVSFMVTLVKGLGDHCTSNTPSVEHLTVVFDTESEEVTNKTMFWLMKAKFMPAVENVRFHSTGVTYNDFTWLAGLKSLSELRELYITIKGECSPPPAGLEWWPVSSKLTTVEMDINLPSNTAYDLHSSTDGMVDSILKSVLKLLDCFCLTYLMRPWLVSIASYYTVPVLSHWS